MKVTERMKDKMLLISSSNYVLSIPTSSWGHPNVCLNDKRIPSARIWGMIGKYTKQDKKVPRPLLLNEARRAEIYCQLLTGMFIWTESPRESDIQVSSNIYVRKDLQRIRPLVSQFSIKIGKIEGSVLGERIEELHEVASRYDLFPVAAGENRIMYCKEPEKVFTAFGTRDWARLFVYLKRPGSSSTKVNLGLL